MREVGDRFQNMYFAAKGGNWALAAYMSKRTATPAIRDGLRFHQGREVERARIDDEAQEKAGVGRLLHEGALQCLHRQDPLD